MQVLLPHQPLAERTYDVVVAGGGVAGLASALFAALRGASVLVAESTEALGGTSAWSAGTLWIPGTDQGKKVNAIDSVSEAARYLDNAVGAHSPAVLRQAFLEHGPVAVGLLETKTDVHLRAYAKHPDYLATLPGATLNGRALEPVPFDGRLLGHHFALLRRPIPEFTILGGMMVDRTDINHLLGMGKHWASFCHASALLLRHARDRLICPRGTRLVMGNALVARFLHALSRFAHVTVALSSPLVAIDRADSGRGAVTGVTLQRAGEATRVAARRAVVLAGGGFNRDPQWRAQYLPGIESSWCPGALGHTGGNQRAAHAIGAVWGAGHATNAYFAPVSLRQRADASWAAFPHFVMDRAKPGTMVVDQAGARFVNESLPYHLFGLAQQAAGRKAIPAFLVADARALRTYGLGMVRPGANRRTLQGFLDDGYLVKGNSVAELARALDMAPERLAQSVARLTRHAQNGEDSDFGRGQNAYEHHLGDSLAGTRNPNLGALTEAPFYALKLYPGDIGAAQGLAVNAQAQVTDGHGVPIDCLYAVGNDAQSVMGGIYAAPGITLGPAVVFAYLAARHALQAR